MSAAIAPRGTLQHQHGLAFAHLHGNAEAVAYPDASFDFAISGYGVGLWADPQRWVPEAARLLRPGGRLVFLVNSLLMALCTPADDDGGAPSWSRESLSRSASNPMRQFLLALGKAAHAVKPDASPRTPRGSRALPSLSWSRYSTSTHLKTAR